ncbi:MAG: hypothetical protein HYY30_03830 [Chloroflexi bacterium]|nr:hypothetical protein [Chloroflexota bacterium]
MDVNDAMLVAIRWAHALAGATWVGGGLFYLLVLQPSFLTIDDQSYMEILKRDIADRFKEIVELSVIALVVTGVILSFDRLSQGGVSNLYVTLLGLKVAAAAGMFLLFWSLRQKKAAAMPTVHTGQDGPDLQPSLAGRVFSPSQMVLALGLLLFFLADLLKVIYENGLRSL